MNEQRRVEEVKSVGVDEDGRRPVEDSDRVYGHVYESNNGSDGRLRGRSVTLEREQVRLSVSLESCCAVCKWEARTWDLMLG